MMSSLAMGRPTSFWAWEALTLSRALKGMMNLSAASVMIFYAVVMETIFYPVNKVVILPAMMTLLAE